MTRAFQGCQRLLTAAEMRLLDRTAIAELGVPALALMENAARAVADAVSEELDRLHSNGWAVAVCGPGNNGGDGLAAARILLARGVRARVVLLADRLSGDAGVNLEAYRKLGAPLERLVGEVPAGAGDVVVDAVFGTGLARPPEGAFAEAIAAMVRARRRGARVVAVDLPSGLSSDDGRPQGACVEADRTVTFGSAKRGHALLPGATLCGPVTVADIGIPRAAWDKLPSRAVYLLEAQPMRALLPSRPPDSHKGTFGHLLAVAGSPEKTGAAAMLCMGALRGGVGLCTVAARQSVVERVVAAVPEAMGRALPGAGPLAPSDAEALLAAAKGKSALAVGPGLDPGPEVGSVLVDLLASEPAALPAVVDADGLSSLASRALLAKLAPAHGRLVFTPHPGEMARLTGTSAADVQADRVESARTFAMEHCLTLVLKGARTVVAAPDGDVAVNPTGNPGMATGGAGDVLTGLVGALLAQGVEPETAAAVGVYVHGLAGDRMAKRRGMMGLIATDLIDGIAEVWAEWGV